MSRKHIKGRGKVTSKMTKDGLVSLNSATGEETRESQREQALDLRGNTKAADFDIGSRHQPHTPVSYTDDPPRRSGQRRQHQVTVSHAGQPEQSTVIPTYSPLGNTPEQLGKPASSSVFKQSDVPSETHSDTLIPESPSQPPGGLWVQSAIIKGTSEGTVKTDTGAISARTIHSSGLRFDSEQMPADTTEHNRKVGLQYRKNESTPEAPTSPNNDSDGAARPQGMNAVTSHKPSNLQFGRGHGTDDTPKSKGRRKQNPLSDESPQSQTVTSSDGGTNPTVPPDTAGASTPSHSSRLRFEDTEPLNADSKNGEDKPRHKNNDARSLGQYPTVDGHKPETENADAPADMPDTPRSVPPDKPDTQLQTNKPGKLQFAQDETAPTIAESEDKRLNKKLSIAQRKYDRTNTKLDKARSKLPTKRKLRKIMVYDEQKGKSKKKLYFEKEVKSQADHIKGPLPLRLAQSAGNSLMLNAHRKIYQVEHENVGIKAAHRAEMFAEGGVRSALHLRKTAPYRKAAKLETKAARKSIKLSYQKALAENPKLKSNMLSRMWQKRKIKKDYAKVIRETKKAAQRAKKAGSVTANAAKAIGGFIKRHPVIAAIVILLLAIVFILMQIISLFGSVGSGGFGAIIASSYLAEDADIDNAELSYTEWETDLQMQLLNVESTYTGYDEYRYDVGDISHNPYELMAYLTTVYQNFPYDAIATDLRTLFNAQHTLTITPSVETRYADPTDANEDGDYEPYDWNVLTVTLAAQSFTTLVYDRMTTEQRQSFDLLMQTKGNRQYIGNPLSFSWLPYVTSNYGWRIHPISGAKDYHMGVDIGIPVGTDIYAGHDGVVSIGYDSGGYGHYVVLTGDNGLVSKYAHLDSVLVSDGQSVKMGNPIAKSGNSGSSTGPHLHLEVIKNGQYLCPLFFAVTGDFDMGPVYGNAGLPMGDGTFAALLAEAESHLGKPYIWGASGPNSFDCSGFVSYVLNRSGAASVGRQTASGLYSMCNPVNPSEAQPGDLIFFHSTFSTSSTITHIGIFVGYVDGRPTMIHAGSPVKYAFLDTAYWQAHFYAYGRLS